MARLILDADDVLAVVRPLLDEAIADLERRWVARFAERPSPRKAAAKDSPADDRWGFTFGVDGVVSAADARRRLGGVTDRTLWNYREKGYIRTGYRRPANRSPASSSAAGPSSSTSPAASDRPFRRAQGGPCRPRRCRD